MDKPASAPSRWRSEVGNRWYLYTGHLWHYGWSIVDVTDPKDPKFVKSSRVSKTPDHPMTLARNTSW